MNRQREAGFSFLGGMLSIMGISCFVLFSALILALVLYGFVAVDKHQDIPFWAFCLTYALCFAVVAKVRFYCVDKFGEKVNEAGASIGCLALVIVPIALPVFYEVWTRF